MNDYIMNATSIRVARSTNRANSKGRVIQLPRSYQNSWVLIWNNGADRIKAFCQTTHEELVITILGENK